MKVWWAPIAGIFKETKSFTLGAGLNFQLARVFINEKPYATHEAIVDNYIIDEIVYYTLLKPVIFLIKTRHKEVKAFWTSILDMFVAKLRVY